MKILILLFFFFIVFSCSGDEAKETQAMKLYREYSSNIIDQFSRHTLYRRGDKIIMETFLMDKTNRYFVDIHETNRVKSFQYSNHRLQYQPKFLEKSKSEIQTLKLIEAYVKNLYLTMSSLDIESIEAGFADHGIDLKICLKSGSQLVYAKDLADIPSNSNYYSYFISGKKFDENWRYFPTCYW